MLENLIGENKQLSRLLERVNANEVHRTRYACWMKKSTSTSLSNGSRTLITSTETPLINIGWPGITGSSGMVATQLNLTGTVTKVIGNTTLTGSGTAFRTELYEGAAILVGTEYNVVTSVVSDTLINVNLAWTGAAAGVAATRSQSVAVAPQSGGYLLSIYMRYAANATGGRSALEYRNNAVFSIETKQAAPTAGIETLIARTAMRQYLKYDLIGLAGYQNSGGALNVLGFDFSLIRIV